MNDIKLALSKMRGIHEYMDISSPSNVDWLILNLQNENSHHPFYVGAMKELLAIKIKFTLFGVADEKSKLTSSKKGHHSKCEWDDCQGGCHDIPYEG